MHTFDRKIPTPTAEQAEATGGEVVNAYLASVCALLDEPAIRSEVIEALFRHPAVQRKIHQHVSKQLFNRGRSARAWEADELNSLAELAFVEFVYRFDPSRDNASFLGGLDVALRGIGYQLQAERSELTADAIAGRAKRQRAKSNDAGNSESPALVAAWCFADDATLDSVMLRTDHRLDLFDEVFSAAPSQEGAVDVAAEVLAVIAVAGLDRREIDVTLARIELATIDGVPPTDRALAEALGMSSSTVQRTNAAAQRKMRLARALLDEMA